MCNICIASRGFGIRAFRVGLGIIGLTMIGANQEAAPLYDRANTATGGVHGASLAQTDPAHDRANAAADGVSGVSLAQATPAHNRVSATAADVSGAGQTQVASSDRATADDVAEASPAQTDSPSPAARPTTDLVHANYNYVESCSSDAYSAYVVTPQPGTDLMPFKASTASPDVEAFYDRAARQQVTWLKTVECTKTGSVNAALVNPTFNSTIWSGYIIGGDPTPANHYAQAGWNMPTISTPAYPASAGEYDMSIWVGLGGTGVASNFGADHPLIQAGTHQTLSADGTLAEPYFWYEVYPLENEIKISTAQMPVSVGDEVGAVIGWDPTTSVATLGVCNWNTNTCIGFNTSKIGEPSNTTEWIIEAPENAAGTTIMTLPAFTPVNFIGACWAQTTTYSNSSKSGIAYALSEAQQGANGVTGSAVLQNLSDGSPLTPVNMFLPFSTTQVASPGPIGSTGADFTINHQ